MTINERAAYLKGLMEGMSLNKESNEGKLFTALVEAVEEISVAIEDLEEVSNAVCDELDELVDDVEDIEDFLDELSDCCCDYDDDDDFDDDDDDDEDYDFDDDDDVFYTVKCPTCNEEITLDSAVLESGGIKCPACGEELEFDLEEDGCDCGHC